MADNMTWTSEQKQVIDLRDRSLLVSAAAGSGKTAAVSYTHLDVYKRQILKRPMRLSSGLA